MAVARARAWSTRGSPTWRVLADRMTMKRMAWCWTARPPWQGSVARFHQMKPAGPRECRDPSCGGRAPVRDAPRESANDHRSRSGSAGRQRRAAVVRDGQMGSSPASRLRRKRVSRWTARSRPRRWSGRRALRRDRGRTTASARARAWRTPGSLTWRARTDRMTTEPYLHEYELNCEPDY